MIEYTEQHYDEIVEWCSARKRTAPLKRLLPPNGLIIPRVACGFLLSTDASIGILDFYISNPSASQDERSTALDQITEELIQMAKRKGLTALMCQTQISNIEQRAVKFDFIPLGDYRCLFREI